MAQYYIINQNAHNHVSEYFGSLRLSGKKNLASIIHTQLQAEAIAPKWDIFSTMQGHYRDISPIKQLIINKLDKIKFFRKNRAFYDKTTTIY